MTTLTEDLAAEKLQRMTNDELLAHLIERLPAIREALRPAPVTDQTYPKMRKLTLYRDDSTTQVVFENVKHFFWTAGNTVLTIAQYTDISIGQHRYIHWPRERFCWYRDEAQS